jgi:uncharacterized protein
MRTALITGASAGIGKELAIQFAKNNINLILIARRENILQQIVADITSRYAVQVKYYQCDLTDISQIDKLVNQLAQDQVAINYLVNNAGMGTFGAFDTIPWESVSDVIQLNIIAPTYLTKRFLNELASKTEVKILNVASTSAFQPVPNLAVYAATKAYVLFFSEALSVELYKGNISLTTLCPPETETDFLSSSGLSNVSRISKSKLPTATQIAEYGFKKLMENKRLAIYGFKNKMMLFVQRFVPKTMVLKIAANLFK